MRFSVIGLCAALFTLACASAVPEPVAVAPAAGPESDEQHVATAVLSLPEDSVADDFALDALRALEFKSLSKNAAHIRGILPAPDLSAIDDGAIAGATSGGPAGTAAPMYDIDVISFAAHERVKYYADYFLGPTRERFTIWLGRLPRYEGMIRERFRVYGVPEDLVYLALIESGFSNTAVSRANAVGMWQFIASTARRYGLRVDAWVDERRDPFKATDAAARHLVDLNDRFGSWYLAAAAYNGGAGRVSRGIRRLGSQADSLSDATFFDLSDRRYLRRETRDYVPKLIAAALIAKNPSWYGFTRIPQYPPFVFDEITVPDATGLDVLAELADTTVRALFELNPKYVRGVTPPQRKSIVRVPRGTGTIIAQRYAALPPNERVNFIEHVVRKGETLSLIGQRYRVSVTLLRAANGNVHPRRLRIGRRLVIPVSTTARSQAVRGGAPRPSAGVAGVRVHTVRRGDSLWKISRRYNVQLSDLRRWNGILVDDMLSVGRRLRVAAPPGEGR